MLPTIVSAAEVELSPGEQREIRAILKKKSSQRRQSRLSFASRRQSIPDEEEAERLLSQSQRTVRSASRDRSDEDDGASAVRVQFSRYRLGDLMKLIDLELAYVDEYFVQVPFSAMSVIFEVVERQHQKDMLRAADLREAAKKNGSKTEFAAELAAYLANEDKPAELIVAKYAERILKKLKALAGCDEQ